jgi:hypothetical protein
MHNQATQWNIKWQHTDITHNTYTTYPYLKTKRKKKQHNKTVCSGKWTPTRDNKPLD